MLIELGHGLVALALGLCILEVMVYVAWRIRRQGLEHGSEDGERGRVRVAPHSVLYVVMLLRLFKRIAWLRSFAIWIAFALLITTFVLSDFSVELVAAHSHTAKPLLYKISGTWGNHEGSMLLWAACFSLIQLRIFFQHSPSPSGPPVDSIGAAAEQTEPTRQIYAALVATCLMLAFLAFILFTSNPFLRIDPGPINGNGLNPILQDPVLAFHPPILYLGYAFQGLVFCQAVSALWAGDSQSLGRDTIARLRSGCLAAFILLTIGIGLGSWWAYYELGWGGFWFWDPVENAALIPWLVATSLVHTRLGAEGNRTLLGWTLFLSLLGFVAALAGFFLVRSGALTSVHAFATDPERGLWLLMLFGVAGGGALLLYATRHRSFHQLAEETELPAAISRDGAILANNFLLLVIAATVLLGTVYPIILEVWSQERIAVGPPYYAIAVTLPAMLILILSSLGPLLPRSLGSQKRLVRNDRKPLTKILRSLRPITAFGVAAGGLGAGVAFLLGAQDILGLALIFVALFAAIFVVYELDRKLARMKGSDRLRYLPLVSSSLSHLGVAVLALGIAGAGLLGSERFVMLNVGEETTFHNFLVKLDKVRIIDGSNFVERQATLRVTTPTGGVSLLRPGIRFFPNAQQETTEVAILSWALSDFYVVTSEFGGDGQVVWLRLRYRPLAILLWFGCAMIALGGIAALSRNLFRGPQTSSKPDNIPYKAPLNVAPNIRKKKPVKAVVPQPNVR